MKLLPGNAQHIGAREEQQDSFGFSDLSNNAFVEHAGVVAVVADGMGGMAHGDAASKAAVRTFLASYETKSPRESIPQALDRALREANSAVAALARGADLEDCMGTTLAAAAVHNGSLYWISAGDSRVYLLRHGDLARLTSDHVYANELREDVAEGKISRAEAQRNTQRGDLTSYLGLADLPAVDCNIRPFPMLAGESVILCSDGLYRAMSENEIAESFSGDTQDACEALVQRALAKLLPHQDNITIIALTCGSEEAANRGLRTKVAAAVFGVVLALSGFGGFSLWQRLHRPGTPTPVVTQSTTVNGGTSAPAPGDQPGQSETAPAHKSPKPETSTTHVVFYPSELFFDDQNLNQSATSVLTVKNGEAHPISILQINTSGTNRGDFRLQKQPCPMTLQASRECKIAVTFKPQAKGQREATIVVSISGGEKYTAALKGVGKEPRQSEIQVEPGGKQQPASDPAGKPNSSTETASNLELNPPTLNFHEQSVEAVSDKQTITLKNTGEERLRVSIVSMEGDFKIDGGGCSVLEVRQACDLHVAFAPSAPGERNGSAVIVANRQPHKVTFTGNGIEKSK